MRKIYLNRMSNVLDKMSCNDLEAIYITNLTNIRYLTGFTGSAGSLLILPEKQIFITDGRYIEQSKNQVKESEIIITNENHLLTIKKSNVLKGIVGDIGTAKNAYEANAKVARLLTKTMGNSVQMANPN